MWVMTEIVFTSQPMNYFIMLLFFIERCLGVFAYMQDLLSKHHHLRDDFKKVSDYLKAKLRIFENIAANNIQESQFKVKNCKKLEVLFFMHNFFCF